MLPDLTLDFEQRDTSLAGAGSGDLAAVENAVVVAVVAALRASALKVAAPMDLSVIITDAEESRALNAEYRGRDNPTNVLSFPATEPEDLHNAFQFALAGGPPVMLGDMVICAPVVAAEAKAQNKPLFHHLAHLSVHGVLHLMGYDHIEDDEALEMEALERDILAELDIPDPYEMTLVTDETNDG